MVIRMLLAIATKLLKYLGKIVQIFLSLESCHLQFGQFACNVCMREFVYQLKFGADAFYLVLSAYCLVGVWQESTLLSLMPITMIYIS